MSDLDFPNLMGPVAHRLLGEPNKARSTRDELRWGSKGSLAVHVAGSHKGTWHDHEAKEGGGVLDLIVREMGGTPAEAAAWLKREMGDVAGQPEVSSKGKVEAVYDYRDEAGEVLFKKLRIRPPDGGKRTFSVKRADGRWGIGDAQRVLYRLPEVIEAVAHGYQVFVAEGEKDADRLANAGLTATTNFEGAGTWRDDYAGAFAGAHVVILPDNDAAGRKHANTVARALGPVASSVRVLDLPALPDKGDVSDWMDAGGTVEDLLELVDRCPPWQPATNFPAVYLGEEDDHPPRAWLAKGMLAQGDLSVIYGPSGSGKSFLALDAALSIATGTPWLGHATTRAGVVYVAAEGAGGLRRRMKAWRLHHEPELPVPFAMVPRVLDLRSKDSDVTALAEDLGLHCKRMGVPVGLIVVDTLSRSLAGGTDAEPRDIAEFLLEIEKLKEVTKAHVLIVHHTGKDQDRGMRGSTALRDYADTVIKVADPSIDGDIRKAIVDKQKDGEEGSVYRFTLPQCVLGTDADGDDITSCVVQLEDVRECDDSRGPKLSDTQLVGLKALRKALGECGEPSPGGQIPTSSMVVRLTTWRTYAERDGLSLSEDPAAVRQAFKRLKDRLQARNIIGVSGEWVWLMQQA